MVDSREKGARAETAVRDVLRLATDLQWERVPGSGALNVAHKLKGDLYIPNEKNLYCVEVKHYSESQINHSLISGKSPLLLDWWKQTIRQATQVDKEPLLIFKHDRSKLYCAFILSNKDIIKAFPAAIFIQKDGYEFWVSLLDDYLNYINPKFIL